jgi:hypothetical protein
MGERRIRGDQPRRAFGLLLALGTIKLLTEDPAVIADRADEIKANYTKYFGT